MIVDGRVAVERELPADVPKVVRLPRSAKWIVRCGLFLFGCQLPAY